MKTWKTIPPELRAFAPECLEQMLGCYKRVKDCLLSVLSNGKVWKQTQLAKKISRDEAILYHTLSPFFNGRVAAIDEERIETNQMILALEVCRWLVRLGLIVEKHNEWPCFYIKKEKKGK